MVSTSVKQRTIKAPLSFAGVGLHTGSKTTISLKPAEENAGIKFIRVDLPDKPVVDATLSNVLIHDAVPRCTTVGHAKATMIHTVEHFMSVLCALQIDNLIVEIDGNEIPGLDGSGIEFLKGIQKVGVKEQGAERKYFKILQPVGVQNGESSIYIVPSDDFKISYTLDYENPHLRSQFFSSIIDEDVFEKQIGPCRTFCLESESKMLRDSGLGQGANYQNTLVVGEQGVIENELRFQDEFVRHKVLDFIGDIYLLGMPIKGHAFAVKSGHRLNLALLKKIYEQKTKWEKREKQVNRDWSGFTEYNIQDILSILPHRYPFLLVDRVFELEKGKKALGIKNVTMNEDFFQGHFPSRPVMPGVLMVEAMAQTAGVVVLTNERHRGKVALFMSADNVKFRKLVEPGDQLLIETELINDKVRFAKVRAVAKVGEEIVSEANIAFSYTDSAFLE